MPRTRDVAIEELFASLTAFNRAVRVHAQSGHRVHPDLSRQEVATLSTIAVCGPCRSSALVDKLGVGASVVSRQLAHLDALGLVRRERDPEDGRAELMSLTEVGRERMAEARAAYLRRLTEGLADWDVDRLTVVRAALDELATVLAPRPPRTISTTPAPSEPTGPDDPDRTAGEDHR